MRKGIFFIASIFVILIIFSLFSLLLPSRIVITSQANVLTPVDRVKDQVLDFSAWHNWYPAFSDSTVTKTYLTKDSSYVKLENEDRIVYLKRVPVSADTVHIQLSGNSTSDVLYEFVFIDREGVHSNIMMNTVVQLKWYPWEKVKGLFMQKMAESHYDSMVERIKTAAENS